MRSTEDAGRKPGGRLESLPHKGSSKKFVALGESACLTYEAFERDQVPARNS